MTNVFKDIKNINIGLMVYFRLGRTSLTKLLEIVGKGFYVSDALPVTQGTSNSIKAVKVTEYIQ